jgi:hypothetical protein
VRIRHFVYIREIVFVIMGERWGVGDRWVLGERWGVGDRWVLGDRRGLRERSVLRDQGAEPGK